MFIAHFALDPSSGTTRQQSLKDHLYHVADLAEVFAKKVRLPYCGRLVGLLHDFGKYSQEFQHYLLSAWGIIPPTDARYVNPKRYKGKINHSFAGGQYLWQRIGKSKNHKKDIAQLLSLCIISHHSGLKDCVTPNGVDAFSCAMNAEEEKTHYAQCKSEFEAEISVDIDSLLDNAVRELHQVLGKMYTAVKNELPSNTNLCVLHQSQAFNQGVLARYLLSCILDADRTDTADFTCAEGVRKRAKQPKDWNQLVQRLENYLDAMAGNRPIDEIRRTISEECVRRASETQGIFTLTVPTGGGKTLSSLRFALRHAQAHNLDRVIYVIPYTSIIDQNADIARKILETDEDAGTIVLEHHSSFLPERDSEDEDEVKLWEVFAENWSAPVVFTTMVQFLEALFGKGTRHARRMHALARSVIVFDEVQTLPLRCLYMFCNAVQFLIRECSTTVVLCTATQPCLNKVPKPQLGSLPLDPKRELTPNVPSLFRSLRRTEFVLHCDIEHTLEDAAVLAEEELEKCGSCLIICNTKKSAETLYSLCRAKEGTHKFYLSTNLCSAHRMANLSAMRDDLQAGRPVLCVSTQLIECGVDISFPSVIRLAAGLDSVLQAAGRCNRHGESKNGLGRVHVVWANESGLDILRDIREGRDIFLDILSQCGKMLRDSGNDLTDPKLIDFYFQRYLTTHDDVLPYAISPKKDRFVRDDTLLRILGTNDLAAARCALALPMLRQSFATAASLFKVIDSPTTGIITPYSENGRRLVSELCSSAFIYRKKELLRQAQRYSVNVFHNMLNELVKADAVKEIQGSGILCLQESFYDEEYGIVTHPTSNMSLLEF